MDKALTLIAQSKKDRRKKTAIYSLCFCKTYCKALLKIAVYYLKNQLIYKGFSIMAER